MQQILFNKCHLDLTPLYITVSPTDSEGIFEPRQNINQKQSCFLSLWIRQNGGLLANLFSLIHSSSTADDLGGLPRKVVMGKILAAIFKDDVATVLADR
jgi:hypothetical protein